MEPHNTSESGGWRRRKCKPGVMVPAFKKRRAPSHLNSCVKDPGYIKFNRLVSEFVSELSTDNVADRTETLRLNMHSFLGRVGEDLLSRATQSKTLCKLVLQELAALQYAVNALSPSGATDTCMHSAIRDIAKLFPSSAEDREARHAHLNMRALAEEYAAEQAEARARRKEALEASGACIVDWSDSD